MRSRATLATITIVASALAPAVGTAQAAPVSDTTATAVSDVELRWGLNNESNNAGFAPGTYNFLSAGKIGDPGKGGLKVVKNGRKWSNGKPAHWSASSGNVAIVKNTSSGPRTATWAGLSTDPKGRKISSPTDSRFSGHEVVLAGGDGWVDTDDGRAKIRWDGDFSVIYYSGMTFFYVSDPELNVGADGKGRLTATLGGYGTSRVDMSQWRPLANRRVVLAELDGVGLESGRDSKRPTYERVRTTIGKLGVKQVRYGKHWGAWPQSFVTYQQRTGQGSYWYSSGGQTDVHKVPLPLRIGGTDFGGGVTVPAGNPRDRTLPPEPDEQAGPDNGNGDGNNGPDNNDGNGNNDRDENDPDNSDNTAEPFEVDDAQWRWGINNESNNAGFAPNTYNFFSAGKVNDPGRGGATVSRGDWNATAGDVAIEKRQPDGSYDTATWNGLSTMPSGEDLTSPTAGRFSEHQVVMDGGSGTIDPRRRTARITWDGDFTVLYYSGMTFFYVSDPTLVVRNGRGTMTATLGGFGTDRANMTTWKPLSDKRVTLANLGKVHLGKAGFTAKPKYRGVSYDAPKSISAQQRGQAFGAFPRSFVDYQVRTGQAAYWYSSGGQTDRFKVALPMTISYDADNAVDPPDKLTPAPDDEPTDDPPDDGSPTPAPDDDGADTAPDPTPDDNRVADPTPEDTAVAASPLSTTHSADQPETRSVAASTADRAWMWWLGGGLLAIAVALTLTTTLLTQHRSSKS